MTFVEILVTLINAETGGKLGEYKSPASELPDIFEPEKTTKRLGSILWVVKKAIPATASEYRRTGRVTVYLTEIKTLPIDQITATLPSICDTIPHVQPVKRERQNDPLPVTTQPPEMPVMGKKGAGPSPSLVIRDGDIFRFHADLWRQKELISIRYANEINAELDEIVKIYRNHCKDNNGVLGFRKIHIRKLIQIPILEKFPFQSLLAEMPQQAQLFNGIGYGGWGSTEPDGQILGGYAFEVGPMFIFGEKGNGLIKSFCLHESRNPSIHYYTAAVILSRIMSANKLILVDWCRCIVLDPSNLDGIAQYLNEYFC